MDIGLKIAMMWMKIKNKPPPAVKTGYQIDRAAAKKYVVPGFVLGSNCFTLCLARPHLP